MALRCTQLVSLLAQYALGREIQQDLAREDEASTEVDIVFHLLGIDQELSNEVRRFS